jgi:ADP-glucose pyrophosphorylase
MPTIFATGSERSLHWRDIGTIDAYYAASMELRPDHHSIYFEPGLTSTHVNPPIKTEFRKTEPPMNCARARLAERPSPGAELEENATG